MDWSQDGSPVWQAVHEIIQFRRDHWETLSQAATWLEVTKAGLIHVVRNGHEKIEAWFNTTGKTVSLGTEAALSRGYQGGELANKGYVFELK
ncbi:Protein of unknown function [Lactobacillus equicursoris DSM 19284 = JCM 14600 = CIP 110162]|nr:Protein of unknown function [Lactobacillus equicursoris DSM 19284 = JCM 14600 = CIP 110162]